MSKWRPSKNDCIYVIPDIHGMNDALHLILNRILPLRKSEQFKDKIVFLGDYIDRRFGTPEVLDILIGIKEEYPNQIFFLKGNHEEMLLDTLKPHKGSAKYLMWMKNGGEVTLSAYLARAGVDIQNPYLIERFRIDSYIPKDHLEFIDKLSNYHMIENYIFVHGGCDPFLPLINQDPEVLVWDRSLYDACKNKLHGNLSWSKCIITGHNCEKDGRILIRDKFMMLDRSSVDELLVLELRSMTAMVAKPRKHRMIKFDLTPFVKYPLDSSVFQRRF